MRPFLGQVGGREIDDDTLRWKRQAGGEKRRTHPLAAFRYRLVGQAHDREEDVAGRDLHLNVDGASLDALEGDG